MKLREIERSGGHLLLLGLVTGVTACLYSMSAVLAQQASDNAGHQAFNNSCRTCHSIKEGDNRLGPNLHKIVGRKAGSVPNYNYSQSMKEAGFDWDQDKLTRFLVKPDEIVSDNKMQPYGGVSKDEAASVIAYMQSAAEQK